MAMVGAFCATKFGPCTRRSSCAFALVNPVSACAAGATALVSIFMGPLLKRDCELGRVPVVRS